MKNIGVAAEEDVAASEMELKKVLANEKAERAAFAKATRNAIIKKLLALKKIQQEKVASMKGNVSVAINVAKTLSSLDNSLKEKISMAKKQWNLQKRRVNM